MAKFIYQHPADNVAGVGTLTPSTEDTDYPKEYLYDSNPAKPFRFTATTGSLIWSYSVAQKIDLVSIIHHNLTPGLEVRIQGNATNSWGAPTLNQLITIPALDADNYPVNAFVDLTGIGSRTFLFWRLIIVGVNSANISIGEIWMGSTKRTLDNVDITYPVNETTSRPIIEHQTDYGVSTIYNLGVKLRKFETEARILTPAQMILIKTWWDSCNGRATPCLIYPDAEAAEYFGAQLVRWSNTERPDKHTFPLLTSVPLTFTEVSRGLAP